MGGSLSGVCLFGERERPKQRQRERGRRPQKWGCRLRTVAILRGSGWVDVARGVGVGFHSFSCVFGGGFCFSFVFLCVRACGVCFCDCLCLCFCVLLCRKKKRPLHNPHTSKQQVCETHQQTMSKQKRRHVPNTQQTQPTPQNRNEEGHRGIALD